MDKVYVVMYQVDTTHTEIRGICETHDGAIEFLLDDVSKNKNCYSDYYWIDEWDVHK